MSTRKEQLQADLTTAMKAKDALTVSTLRMALAAVMNAEVAGKQQVTLTDDEVLAVLAAEARKRTESAEVYEEAGRTEMAAKERAEAEVLKAYLPAELSDDELASVVAEQVAAAAGNGLEGPKAMGAVIKAVREQVGSAADGGRIAAAVKGAL